MIEMGKLNGFLIAIKEELRKAEGKFPKFCDGIIPPLFDFDEEEKRWKKWNDEAKQHFGCDLFQEEFYEALNAYVQGDKAQCLKELAQCGAVILRMMEFVGYEIEFREAELKNPSPIYPLHKEDAK